MKKLSPIISILLLTLSLLAWQIPGLLTFGACPDETPGYLCGPTEIDDSVRLLLHFDNDTDWDFLEDCSGSTYSPHGPDTLTWGGIGGSPDINANSAFFGDSGVSFDGTNDFYVFSPDEEFHPRTGNFTLDLYAKLTPGGANTQAWFGSTEGAPDIMMGTNVAAVGMYNAVNGWYSFAVDPRDGKWHHYAFSRSGTTALIFVDGKKLLATPTFNDDMWDPGQRMGVGWNASNAKMNGDMDELRWTIGEARWTENFTPPIYPAGVTEQGRDAYDVLLVHSNNYQGYTVFTDSSDSAHTIYTNGNAKHDLDGRKFLLSGISLDGTNDNLQAADSDDWDFGSGDFTIELWVYPKIFTSKTIINQWVPGAPPWSGGWDLQFDATNKINFYWDYGADIHSVTGTTAYTVAQWIHIAVSKSGNSIYLFENGKKAAEAAFADTIDPSGNSLYVGEYSSGAGDIQAYYQEIRISKGIGRYTSNFTPQEMPY